MYTGVEISFSGHGGRKQHVWSSRESPIKPSSWWLGVQKHSTDSSWTASHVWTSGLVCVWSLWSTNRATKQVCASERTRRKCQIAPVQAYLGQMHHVIYFFVPCAIESALFYEVIMFNCINKSSCLSIYTSQYNEIPWNNGSRWYVTFVMCLTIISTTLMRLRCLFFCLLMKHCIWRDF